LSKETNLENKYKIKNSINSNAILILEDGEEFHGFGIGAYGISSGEICFNTSITGYQEILTDPSYSGQIINFTFPHIGNVGANNEDLEGDKTWVKGAIFSAEVTHSSNYRALENLDQWLKKNNITAIYGIDTRKLTLKIRKFGPKKAREVTCKKSYQWIGNKLWNAKGYEVQKNNKYNIVAIDYGIKTNILRNFSELGCKVTVVPSTTAAKDILALKPDGVFLSNGPGDPDLTGKYAIKIIQEIISSNTPVFGICLGHQLLALSLGAKTKRMHQGHRGANHPVKNLTNNKVEITSQNHGFEVTKDSLPKDVEVTHVSLFDTSIEGIKSKVKPAFSVQYHPEASPGPHDSNYLFKDFINLIEKNKINA